MKSLSNSLAFLVCVLLVAPNAYSMIDSALAFYPLAKGNLWQYKSTQYDSRSSDRPTHYYTVFVAGDTLLSNGKRYFQLQCSRYSLVHPRFQRFDSSTGQVFAYDTAQGGREVQIDSLQGLPHSRFMGSRLLSLSGTSVTKIDSQRCLEVPVLCRKYYSGPGIGVEGNYLYYSLGSGLGLAFVSTGYFVDDPPYDYGTSDTLIYTKVNGQEQGRLVSVLKPPPTPADFVLYQNYPNPFNPTTTITFSIPQASYVHLAIYDNLGREVKLLLDEGRAVGIHKIDFNANILASGVYFYRLNAGSFSSTKKLLLIK